MQHIQFDCKDGLPEGFLQSLDILLAKPHVLNRRLCGTKSVCQLTVASRVSCTQLAAALFQLDSHKKIAFAARETFSELITSFLCKLNTSAQDTSVHREDLQYEILLRELLPRDLSKYYPLRELIICERIKPVALFIPLAYCLDNRFLHSDDAPVMISMELDPPVKLVLHVSSSASISAAETSNAEPLDEVLDMDESADGITAADNADDDSGSKRLKLSDATVGEVLPRHSGLSWSLPWVQSRLMSRLVSWSSLSSLNTKPTSLVKISIERYNTIYNQLKTKYAKKLVQWWPEATDPQKFVFEDIGIASYLLTLWEEERSRSGEERRQTFVDLGCGNGLLVYLLTMEGHQGYGIDVRKRKIWDMYEPGVDLKIQAITPSDDSLFPHSDWIIGNHSDELTPWIPLIAARSSFTSKFFLIPCCPWDFTCKFQGGTVAQGTSKFQVYLDYIYNVAQRCGFVVERDVLRIPSTKRACLWPQCRDYCEEDEPNADRRRTDFLLERCKKSRVNDGSSDSHNHDNEIDHHRQDSGDSTINQSAAAKAVASSQWVSGFEARVDDQYGKQRAPLSKSEIEDIGVKVLKALLACDDTTTLTTSDGRSWNAGGSLLLRDAVALFDATSLKAMSHQCGGLQTVLRNLPNVFLVAGGRVRLRGEEEGRKRIKKPGKGADRAQARKTRLCFLNTHHPHGCLLPAHECRFAHGTNDICQHSDSLSEQC